jgi:hypothetical protein
VRVFNRGTTAQSAVVRLYSAPLSARPSSTDWTPIATVNLNNIPAGGSLLSDAVTLSADAARGLICAQIIANGLPDVLQQTSYDDYAALLRWSTHIALKQPSARTIQRGQDTVITFTARNFAQSTMQNALKVDLSSLPVDSQVRLQLNGATLGTLPTGVQRLTDGSLQLPAGKSVVLSPLQFSDALNAGLTINTSAPVGVYPVNIQYYNNGYMMGRLTMTLQMA